DPGSGLSNTSASISPTHTFTSLGTYSVNVVIRYPCFTDTLNALVNVGGAIVTPPNIAIACSSYTAPWGAVYTQSGTYSDTLTTATGCDSIISVNLTITGAIVTPPITASACSSYTASWGTTYTQSGTYSDTLTTASGCDSIISVNLSITGSVTSPPVNVNACDSYVSPWGTVYTQSGTYSDTLTTVNGCDSIVSINLALASTILSSQTASACSSFVSPSGNVYTQSGIYSDTLSTVAGCDSIITTTLTITGVPTLSATASPDTCDRNTGTATATASGTGGTYAYLWSNGSSGNGISNLGNGLYTVTVTDQNGCSSSAQVAVSSIPGPTVTAGASSFIILAGDSVQLNGTGATNYQWSPTDGLSCTTCDNPVATPAQTTTYTVTGTDNNGCTGTAAVTITVDILCNELFVPDIFSPEGTGPQANEKVCVFGNCISEMLFAVYNRWGQLVFETNDPLACWDGTFNRQECMSGVYAYRLTVTQTDGKAITRSGNITLVR
ncbi:MAG: gliding motility-associated C-terminal domain-containing protein, partial [Bacteroidota bacterium]